MIKYKTNLFIGIEEKNIKKQFKNQQLKEQQKRITKKINKIEYAKEKQKQDLIKRTIAFQKKQNVERRIKGQKQYDIEQKNVAQKQATAQYKKDLKKNVKPIAKKSKQLEKVNKSVGKTFKKVTKIYGYKPKLSRTLMGFANANNPPQTTAGRPKKVYKHTSPISGKPVPAEIYYSHMRQFKNIQERRVEDARERQIAEYAKRGISPSKVAQIQERIKQQRLLEQIQRQAPTQQIQNQTEQLPEGTVIDKSTRVWKYRRGKVDTDWTAFGKRKVVRGLPSSFFN